jgi:hypothetical protein
VPPRTLRCRTLLVLACAFLGAGCQTFRPQPLDRVPFEQRVETQERDGLQVSVTVLSADEARKVFGVDLYGRNIQPVWVHLRNGTDLPYWFMLHALDPDYYSTGEAAYKSHRWYWTSTNRRIDEHFERLGIIPALPPRGETSGFAFTNVKLGTKEVNVRLLTERGVEDFRFYVPVPGFQADYHAVAWDELAGSTEFVELESDRELFEALQELPCCTTRRDGSGSGDPLNLVVISPRDGLLAFLRAGWDETELLTLGSAWRSFRAFLFDSEYRYSPMSALYFEGRPQDIGLQKARDTIHERNHLRLWATKWRYRGDTVWVGTITRDIGVYMTTRAWNLTTHAIDPDVDEARHYVLEDLLTTESVKTLALVDGIGQADSAHPHRNLMFAPYWTDGRRAVVRLVQEGERVDISELESFGVFRLGDAIRALEGQRLEGGGVAGPAEEPEGRADDGEGSTTDGPSE